jgi:hypothetical protein
MVLPPSALPLPERQQQQDQQTQPRRSRSRPLEPSQLDAALSVCASVEQVLWLLQAPPASSTAAATQPAFLAAALRRACSLLREQQQQQVVVAAEVRVALAATALARLADYLAAAPLALGSAAPQPQQAPSPLLLPLDTLAPLLLSVAVLKDGHDWSVGYAQLRPKSSSSASSRISPAAASASALALSASPAAQGLDRLLRALAPEEVCLHAALASASMPQQQQAVAGRRRTTGSASAASATAAYALARLGPGAARPPPSLCSAMARAVLLGGGGGNDGALLPPKDLALGLWGLATLRIPLGSTSEERVSGGGQAVAVAATADNNDDLVAQFCAASLPRLSQFNAQDLSQVLWSLATARARVPRSWLVAAARALRDRAAEAQAAAKEAAEGGAWAMLSGSARRRTRRDRAFMAPQAAANASWALAVLAPRCADDDSDADAARASSLLGSCAADAILAAGDANAADAWAASPQLASNAAWAAARLAQQLRGGGAAGAAVVEEALRSAAERALFSAPPPSRSSPSLRDWANALWACAVLRLEPPAGWQQALWQHSPAVLAAAAAVSPSSAPSPPSSSSSAAVAVADLAWAAARLSLSPPRAWRVDLSRAASACFPRMTRQQLAGAAWASVRLGVAPMPAGEVAAWWRSWASAASASAVAASTSAPDSAAAAARDASLMLFAVGTARAAAPHSMVASAALADPLWLARCTSGVATAAAAEGLPTAEVARSSAMALFAVAHLAGSGNSSSGPTKQQQHQLLPAVAQAWPCLAAPLALLSSAEGAATLDAEHTAMALWATGRIASLSSSSAQGEELLEPAREAAQRLQERAAALVLRSTRGETLARLLTALASAGDSVPAPGPRVVEPIFRAWLLAQQQQQQHDNNPPTPEDAEAAAAALALLTRGSRGGASWPSALRRDVALAVVHTWPALSDARRAAACIAGLARLGGQASATAPVVPGRAWLAAAQWRALRFLPELDARDLAAMLSGFATLSARAKRCAPSPEWLEAAAAAVVLRAGGSGAASNQAAVSLARASLGLARMAHASGGPSPAWAAELAGLLCVRVFAAASSPMPGGTLRRAAAALALLHRLPASVDNGDDSIVYGGVDDDTKAVVLAALERSAAAGALELGHLAGTVAALRLPPPRSLDGALVSVVAGCDDKYARALLEANGWTTM